MSSPTPINRERVDLARSSTDGIFPVGQAVVARILNTETSNRTNPPAVVIRYFKSAPRDLLPARRRGPSGPLPARATYPVAIKTPERDGNWSGVSQRFASLLARGLPTIFPQSVRGTFRAGVMNFCRYLTGWSIGALAQPRKQSSRRFTQGFFSSVAAVLHERSQTQENCNVRQRL